MDKEQIIEEFIDKLGEPDNKTKLEEYISFCIKNNNIDIESYYERHHILPRSAFPEHITHEWNISNLSYSNHVLCHFILAEAYLTRKFSRTLNFLKNKTDEEVKRLKTIISESNKKYWKNLSKEEYDARCLMYSVRMKKMMHAGSEFHKKVCEGLKEYYENNPQRQSEISVFFKNLWKNLTKEEYDEWRKNMKWSDERRVYQSKISKDNWNDPSYRKKCTEKLTIINKDINKRLDASKKIKNMWKDSSFREKMLKRKCRGSDGSKLKEKWADPIWREYMLKSRQLKREEKLKNETT